MKTGLYIIIEKCSLTTLPKTWHTHHSSHEIVISSSLIIITVILRCLAELLTNRQTKKQRNKITATEQTLTMTFRIILET